MRKADGVRFEKEFRDVMKERYYIRRLPTLRTGYAGSTQPADFILVGNNFNYVEVKETARDRFSFSTYNRCLRSRNFLNTRKELKIRTAV